jgi:hypothetical protein
MQSTKQRQATLKATKGLVNDRRKSVGMKPLPNKKPSMLTNTLRTIAKPIMAAGKAGDAAMSGIVKSASKALPKFKKGGMVHKTGPAIVHKGERVLTKKQASKFNARKYEATRKSVFGLGKNKK